VEILNAIKSNMGALVVGALWMIYVIGDRLLRDKVDRRAQTTAVNGTGNLISQLNTSLQDAIRLGTTERDRADKLSDKVSDLSIQVGKLESALLHAEDTRDRLQTEVKQLRATVEELAVTVRNKDKSIAELVDLNRKILRSMGAALPVDAKE
jgi:septal ring factor EnvC (AmiA/AmiB activator)